MATPEFIVKLREKIGHDPLWLPGVTGLVFDRFPDPQQILLTHRQDNGRWALVTGILEPGESPAQGLLREIQEETGVLAQLGPLIDVDAVGPIIFPNEDECSFLNVTFLATALSGEARVNDDENDAVAWCPLDALPDSLTPRHARLIRLGTGYTGTGASYEL